LAVEVANEEVVLAKVVVRALVKVEVVAPEVVVKVTSVWVGVKLVVGVGGVVVGVGVVLEVAVADNERWSYSLTSPRRYLL